MECAAKVEIVLRLVRGEAIDEVARESQVPVHELEEWRRVFLESGQQGLKRHGLDPEAREVRRLQAKVEEMTMRLDLAEHLLEKRVRGGPAEAAEMSRRHSPATGKRYPLRVGCGRCRGRACTPRSPGVGHGWREAGAEDRPE